MHTRSLGSIVREERKTQGRRQEALASGPIVGLRFNVDLEAGNLILQLAKPLQFLATLGCSVSIATPERDQ